ncbi:HEPN domain-containing protein [Paradesulfitobacterium aromaticivorans]
MIPDLSKWRLEKAEVTFRDGEELERLGSYHSAINRYYYAAFHAVRALLATKSLDSAKHSGVISYFNREFVKIGVISRTSSRALSDLFRLRSHADYDDFREFSREDCNMVVQLEIILC